MNTLSNFLRLIIFISISTFATFAQNTNFTATYTSTYQDATAPFGQVNAGDKISYAIKIENKTSSAITNITLTNPPSYNAVLTGSSIASLAAGSFDDTTFSVLQTISAEDMALGIVYYDPNLTAEINGELISGWILDASSNFWDVYDRCSRIATNLKITSFSVTETPEIIDDTSPIGALNAGDKVKYNYAFTNTGLVDLHSNSDSNDFPNFSLAAGKTDTTFSTYRTITPYEFNSGYLFKEIPAFVLTSPTYQCTDGRENYFTSGSRAVSTLPCVNCPEPRDNETVFSLGRNLSLELTSKYQDTTEPFNFQNAGDIIVYTYKIKNIGSETLTNIHITDALIPVKGNPIPSLAPNEVNTTNFTSTHLIKSNDFNVNMGFVINSAIVRGTLPSNIEVLAKSFNPENPYYYLASRITCETCTLTPLEIYEKMIISYEDTFEDLTAPFGKENAGDKINYAITVKNTGNVNLKDVELSLYSGSYNYSKLPNSISSLVVGASDNTTFTHSHTITLEDLQKGYVANRLMGHGNNSFASLSSEDNFNKEFYSTDPTPCTTDCPTQNDYPYDYNGYTITKLNSLKFYLGTYIEDTIAPFGVPNVGEEITYVYKILNNTLNDITNIKITDTNGVVQGSLSKMPKYTEDATSFSRKHVLTQSDLDKGFVLNNASLNCTLLGDDVTINSISSNGGYHALPSGTVCNDCTITYLNYEYALDFEVEDNLTSLSNVKVGDEILYTIKLKNKGNVPHNNLYNLSVTDLKRTVSDRLPDLYSYVISDYPRETSFQEVYTITADDLSKGYVYNNFILQGNTINSYPYSDEVSNFLVKSRDVTPCLSCPVDPNCSNCNITALNNNIKLNAFVDTNNNGIKDSGEFHFPLGKFYYNINDSTTMNEVTTTNGIHFLHGGNPLNTYDLSFTVLPEYAYNYSSSTTFSNVTIGDNVVTYYFPVTVLPYNDNEINLLPIGAPPRPGFTYLNDVSYTNKGNQTIANGTVTFTKNNVSSLISVSESGATITASGFTYNFTNLQPFETRTITVKMQNPTLPVVDFGQVLTNTASISIPLNDINVNNNSASLSQSIVGSFDPNDKSESHNGFIQHSDFSSNDYLTYTIRFENTGNYPAEFVTVIDELEYKLDETTVSMIAASHPYSLTRQNNKLTWLFDNIQLPPSVPNSTEGHGYLVFKIKPKPGYEVGDEISNLANIYFDYNPPIITNVCSTQFVVALSKPKFDFNTISLSPNPVKDILTISSKATMQNIEIYSVLGQLIMSKSIENTNAKLNISDFNKGLYFVKIKGENAAQSFKFIKE